MTHYSCTDYYSGMAKTTISISVATWRELQARKLYPQDSFDAVIFRLLSREQAPSKIEVKSEK